MPVHERYFGPVCTHYNSLQLTTTHHNSLVLWQDTSSLCMLPSVRPVFPVVARACLGYNPIVGNLRAAKSPWSCFSSGCWIVGAGGENELVSLTSVLTENRYTAQWEASQTQCASICPQVTFLCCTPVLHIPAHDDTLACFVFRVTGSPAAAKVAGKT